MIRKEKIEQMKVLISQKQQEIRDLRQLVGEEMIADFYETHNLKEGQHFYFNDKEWSSNGWNKNKDISFRKFLKNIIVYEEDT